MGYDEGKYNSKRTLIVDGLTVAGTDAAAVPKIRMRCPKAMTITGATYGVPLGGTAANDRVVTIGKSLAGTGAISVIGSAIFNTTANNAAAAITVTSTDFASGDHLTVEVLAGTSASTARVDLALEWIEDFS
jgi:hypothetical protein